MKIRDIVESRNLREFAATDSQELLDMLAQVLASTDDTDPAHQQASKILDQLVATAKTPAQPTQQQPRTQPQQVQKPQQPQQPQKTAPTQPQVTEAAGKLTPEEQAKIEFLRKSIGKNNKLEAALADPSLARSILQIHALGINIGQDIQFAAGKQWDETLQKSAAALADKVVNNAAIIHDVIKYNEKQDTAVEESLEEAGKKDAGKKEETGEVMRSKIIEILRTIFEKPVRTQTTRASTADMSAAVAAFMEKCKKGIVDFNKVLQNTNPDAKIDDEVTDPQDKKIYNLVKNEVFTATPGTTAGAWGPGEVGLAVLANPVTKGTGGGDLRVLTPKGPVEVELKGMKSSTAGGRFNSKGIAKATDAAAKYRTGADIFISELLAVVDGQQSVPRGKDWNNKVNKLFTKVKNQKTGATKIKKVETFDLEALRDIWNPKLVGPASAINPQATKKACLQFLKATIEAAILPEGVQHARQPIADMLKDPNLFYKRDKSVGGGFGLNWLGIQANFAKILYAVYTGVDKKGVIMFFNTTSSNYYVAKGPEDVKSQIMSHKLKTGNAIIDFAAGQVPASMQVGIE